MHRIIGEGSTGKTRKLMLFAKEKNVPFACSNPAAMREKAFKYGITGIDFIDYLEIPRYDAVVIDELERFLPTNILGYSITAEG